MIPHAGPVLGDLARVLTEEIAPSVEQGFAKAALTNVALMLGAAAAAWDDAAQNLSTENAALRALFSHAAVQLAGTDIAAELREAALCRDETLRISALQKANQSLLETLIELHQAVELLDGEPAREIEAAIWRVLRAGTEWRRTPYDPF